MKSLWRSIWRNNESEPIGWHVADEFDAPVLSIGRAVAKSVGVDGGIVGSLPFHYIGRRTSTKNDTLFGLLVNNGRFS